MKSKKYKNVYGNVHINVPGYIYIDNDVLGKYDLRNALILIDEGMLFADNRAYKSFPQYLIDFFCMHRHYNLDIVIFTQQYDGMDKKIRVVTDRLYYIYKTPLIGHWISKYYRIPYGVHIPKKDSEHLMGQIIQGYWRPNFIQKLLNGGCLYRPKYYKYFDSWVCKELPPLPKVYKPVPPKEKKAKAKHFLPFFRYQQKKQEVENVKGECM